MRGGDMVFFQINTKVINKVNPATEKQHNLIVSQKPELKDFSKNFQNSFFLRPILSLISNLKTYIKDNDPQFD